MTATFDQSLADVLAALDDARDVAAAPSPARSGSNADIAVLLATVRLEMSVARAGLLLERADDVEQLVAALEAAADAAGRWLGDPVIEQRLGGMKIRDRAAAVTCRVQAATAELRRLADLLDAERSNGLDPARRSAIRTMRSVHATLQDAVLSVRHAA